MNKDEGKKAAVNQTAFILNYQPQIEHQHIYLDGKPKGNPQESTADEKKQEVLKASNTVIRTQTNSGQPAVDLLKLYNFIANHFVSEIQYKYEWYALRRFLEKYHLLRDCDNEQFATQMNDHEWFGSCKKPCEANEMNYYNYLNSVQPDLWVEKTIPLGGRATKNSVARIYKSYQRLELYKEQILS